MNVNLIFPKALAPIITGGGRCYGAWTKDRQPVAAALLAPAAEEAEELCLLDLCVEQSFREQGVARALLQNLAAALAKEGKRSLRVRCMGGMNQVTEIYELLVTAGFLPCLLTGRMLSWQLTDWLDSPLAEQMKETPVPVTNVCDALSTERALHAQIHQAVFL